MPSESTPLIQTVHVAPPRHRYPHNTCRRFFTIASCAILIAGFTTFLINSILIWPYEYNHGRRSRFSGPQPGVRRGLDHEELETILLDTPSSERAEEWLRYYTAGPHLAGKNLSQVNPTMCRAWF